MALPVVFDLEEDVAAEGGQAGLTGRHGDAA